MHNICFKNSHKALTVTALALLLAGAAQAQAYVNVTVGGAFAPHVYGQIVIGSNPPPPVVNPQPVIVGPMVYGAPVIYLHVPPEQSRDWGRYCARYNACGRPVQFVRVDMNQRWWEQHNEHLRGRDHYREPDQRHDNRNHDSRRGRDEQRRFDDREERRR